MSWSSAISWRKLINMDSTRNSRPIIEAKTPYISKEEASSRAMVGDDRMLYVRKEEARENIKVMGDIGFNDSCHVIGQSKSGEKPYVMKDDFHEFEDGEWTVISKRTNIPHASLPYFMAMSARSPIPNYTSNLTMEESEQRIKWLEEERLEGFEQLEPLYRFYPWYA